MQPKARLTLKPGRGGSARREPVPYHDLMSPAESLAIEEEIRRFADEDVAPVAWEIGQGEASRERFLRGVLFGGYGFMREPSADGARNHVKEVYRDCKIAEICEGINEIQTPVIARSIFGKNITG